MVLMKRLAKVALLALFAVACGAAGSATPKLTGPIDVGGHQAMDLDPA